MLNKFVEELDTGIWPLCRENLNIKLYVTNKSMKEARKVFSEHLEIRWKKMTAQLDFR